MAKPTVQITPKLISDICDRNILKHKLSTLETQRSRCDVEISAIKALLQMLDAQIKKARTK